MLTQLRHDPRTVALMLVVPCALLALLRGVLSQQQFDATSPIMLGIFPFVTLFVVTSVATLRERTSGTLERLLTTRMGKADLLAGYALAFGLTGTVQSGLASALTLGVLRSSVPGHAVLLVLLAVLDALLGMALGLLVSAFSATEFQAVQFMPALVLPQVLLCGLFAPRSGMTAGLRWLSDVLPLSYAADGLQRLATSQPVGHDVVADLLIVTGSVVAALCLAASTLRRQTR
ncbi:ABC transporter permease [Acidothermaceae bacterium B102]|nr:ABC transporter permease [Acidothermaceae bacterium B102]